MRPQMVSFAVRRLRDRAQAEDAVQDALLAALEGFERFAGKSSLRTWLFGILKHKIVDRMRTAGREEPLDIDEDLQGEEAGPDEALARRRLRETIAASLSRLPARTARVLVLRELLGADASEICAELGISVSNLWVMLHRGRRRLRQCPDLGRVAAEALAA